MKITKRFTSEKSATSFAKMVNGVVSDLRKYDNRASNFKVVYEKKNRNNYQEAWDFDSDINRNGMHWHTSEDL